MFSAMKKLRVGGGGGGGGVDGGSKAVKKEGEPHPMCSSLQKKFSKGVDYNMKLLLKGDRITGKTALFARLQGLPFPKDADYTPSDEISVASIQWNYKAADDIVKVEVWDVVDKGKKRPQLQGLKLSSTETPDPMLQQPALDAEFVDVYKGAHGVVLIFNMTKPWTFEYVRVQLPLIPAQLPVLVLANFADQHHHRTVTKEQALGLIEEILSESPLRDKHSIRYAESSMKNGFGLKFLHKFLNLPFLILQRNSLLTQLETNERDMSATIQELDLYADSDESSYERFSDGVTKIRRQIAESQAPSPTVDVVLGSQKSASEEKIPKTLVSPNPSSQASNSPSPRGEIAHKSPESIKNVDDFMPDSPGIDTFLLEDDSSQRTTSNRTQGDGESTDDEDDKGVNQLVAGLNEDVIIDDYDIVGQENIVISNDLSSSDEEPPMKENPPRSSPPLNSVIFKEQSEKDDIFQQKDTTSKDKHKKKKKSKKNRKQSEDEERNALEEFLNGIPGESIEAPNAYEEL